MTASQNPIDDLCSRALYEADAISNETNNPKDPRAEVIRELVVLVRAQRAAALGVWAEQDKPDLHTKDINLAHPLVSKRYDLYGVAMAMISVRRDKYALIDLVNWLLVRIDCLTNIARAAAVYRRLGSGTKWSTGQQLDDALRAWDENL